MDETNHCGKTSTDAGTKMLVWEAILLDKASPFAHGAMRMNDL